MATTWQDTAFNQMVTRQALQNAVNTGILGLKNPITGNPLQCVTKSNVENFINVNSANTFWATYQANQLVPKMAIESAAIVVIYTYDAKYSPTSCSAACALSTNNATIYTKGPIQQGSFVYSDATCTDQQNVLAGYYIINNNCYHVVRINDKFQTVYVASVTPSSSVALYGSIPFNIGKDAKIYYSLNGSGGNYIYAGTIDAGQSSCGIVDLVSNVCGGGSVWVQIWGINSGSYQYVPIYFNASETECPDNTGTFGQYQVMSGIVYLTARIINGNFVEV